MLTQNDILANLSPDEIEVLLPQEMHDLKGGNGCHRSRSRSWSWSRSCSRSHSGKHRHHRRKRRHCGW